MLLKTILLGSGIISCTIATKIEHIRLKMFLFSVSPEDSGLSDLSNAS